MPRYNVTVEEMTRRIVVIEAENPDAAAECALQGKHPSAKTLGGTIAKSVEQVVRSVEEAQG